MRGVIGYVRRRRTNQWAFRGGSCSGMGRGARSETAKSGEVRSGFGVGGGGRKSRAIRNRVGGLRASRNELGISAEIQNMFFRNSLASRNSPQRNDQASVPQASQTGIRHQSTSRHMQRVAHLLE